MPGPRDIRDITKEEARKEVELMKDRWHRADKMDSWHIAEIWNRIASEEEEEKEKSSESNPN